MTRIVPQKKEKIFFLAAISSSESDTIANPDIGVQRKIILPIPIEHLYESFVTFYGFKWWIYRARLLQMAIESPEMKKILGNDEVLSEVEREELRYLKSLRYEVRESRRMRSSIASFTPPTEETEEI